MADNDTVTVDSPQTSIVAAYAAARYYRFLAQQAPTHNQSAHLKLAESWETEAKKRGTRFGMKQMPIQRTQI